MIMPGTACGLIPANAGASSRSNENRVMRDKTYVITEVVGISEQSISRAIHTVITRASQTLHALAWFAVLRARQTLKNLDWFKVIDCTKKAGHFCPAFWLRSEPF